MSIISKSEHVRERPLFVFIVHCIGATTLNHSTHKPNMAVKRRQLSVIAVHSCWCFLPQLSFAGPGSFASAGTNSNSEGSRTQPRHVDQPVLFA